jgi:hypothetical protein
MLVPAIIVVCRGAAGPQFGAQQLLAGVAPQRGDQLKVVGGPVAAGRLLGHTWHADWTFGRCLAAKHLVAVWLLASVQ